MKYIWTPTAIRTADAIRAALSESSGNPKVAILTGFSGMGKQTLVNALRSELDSAGVEIIRASYLLTDTKELPEKILVSENPSGAKDAERRLALRGLSASSIVMPGLAPQEILSIFSGKLMDAHATLGVKELIALSMGSTGLLALLLSREFTREQLVTIATEYLIAQMHLLTWNGKRFETLGLDRAEELRSEYLQVEIPASVLSALPSRSSRFPKQLFYDLPAVLEALMRATQQDQPSPFFTAEQSESLLNEMFAYSGTWTSQIYGALATNVPMQYLEEFIRLFREEDDQSRFIPGSRLACFGTSLNKSGVLVRENEKILYQFKAECPSLHDWEARARNEAREIGLELGSGTIFVHKHDHAGSSSSVVNDFAWAFESWAQQRGIDYLVENITIDKRYYYQAKPNQIEFLEDKERGYWM